MIPNRNPIEKGKSLLFELDGSRRMEFIQVEHGSFRMGSPEDAPGHTYDETEHAVQLSGTFWIGKYPITRGQYSRILKADPCPDELADLPVEDISWRDASDFCEALNRLFAHMLPPGYRFDLPTEAQWEFAARGGVLSRNYRYSGSDSVDEVAWYNDNSGFVPHAVGKKHPNELGIYDMSGNVREWCKDFYAQYRPQSVVNPCGPRDGISRVLRGGGYRDVTSMCRTACRDSSDSDGVSRAGFRVAIVPAVMAESYEEIPEEMMSAPALPAAEPKQVRRVRPEEIRWNGTELILAPDLKIELRILASGLIRVERSASHDATWRVQQIPVDTAFFIGKYPVTQELYERVTGENPSCFRGENLPVENVTWYEAVKFCDKLNELAAGKMPMNFVFSLPDQNFREYAAVGGCYADHMKYCGWYLGNSDGTTHPVGELSCNILGLYDMYGNVWEWCRNNAYVNELGEQISNEERARNPRRAIMGGGWKTSEEVCFYQDLGCKPETRDSEIGFRVILRPKENRMQFGYPPLKDLLPSFQQREIGSWNGGFLVLPDHVPLAMQKIPKGRYSLCSTRQSGKSVRHSVEVVDVSKDYWMAQYSVTQQQFEAVMGYNPSAFRGPYRPVESVTVEEAMEFCRKLNTLTEGKRPEGYNFALPKYIFWKCAACGAASLSAKDDIAWHAGNSNGETHDVGQKQASLLGLFDCLGNVREWCANSCHLTPDGKPFEKNVTVVKPGERLTRAMVVMGGGWNTAADDCDFMLQGTLEAKSREIGFRVTLTTVDIDTIDPL